MSSNISPYKNLYDDTMFEYNKQTIEMKEFLKRLIGLGFAPVMKDVMLQEYPLANMLKMLGEEVCLSPISETGQVFIHSPKFKSQKSKSPNLKKKLFEGTSPSTKKTKITNDIGGASKTEDFINLESE
ncbi:unnamed protein product [Amaranthus hypochondriacus]